MRKNCISNLLTKVFLKYEDVDGMAILKES